MPTFNDICFTPAEFARIAKIDKGIIKSLEAEGLVKISRKRVGNVDRKMIRLSDMQDYFRTLRDRYGQDGEGSTALTETAQSLIDQKEVPVTDVTDSTDVTTVTTVTDSTDSTDSTNVTTITDSGGIPFPQPQKQEPEPISEPVAVATPSPVATATPSKIATATDFIPGLPQNKIQMFYNVKGGTGKSTLTAQYVMRAAMMGFNILAVDLDGQGHLSINLDCMDAHERPTVYDILINDLPIEEAIMSIAPGLDLLSANLGLCNIEIPLNQKPRREYRLSEALERVADRYDLIVADTNPAASILNSSMMVAANQVNVVCATNPLSFHGMSLVMATIEEMKREFRKEFNVRIVPNMFDNREVISQEVLGELQEQFPGYCTQTVVNRSADINEATKRRSTVWDVSSKGVAAQDISHPTEELLYF